MAEPVRVAVTGQVAQVGVQRCGSAGIVGRDGTAQRGEQQGCVQGRVPWGALPVSVGMQGVRGSVGDDVVGKG